jgi:long-subunit fatty acid transport protein
MLVLYALLSSGWAWAQNPSPPPPLGANAGTDAWTIAFDSEQEINVGLRSKIDPFDDLASLALELQYRLGVPWEFFFAIGLDRSAGEGSGPPSPLADDRTRLGAGIRYKWSPSLNLGLAYENVGPERPESELRGKDSSKASSDASEAVHIITFNATLEF